MIPQKQEPPAALQVFCWTGPLSLPQPASPTGVRIMHASTTLGLKQKPAHIRHRLRNRVSRHHGLGIQQSAGVRTSAIGPSTGDPSCAAQRIEVRRERETPGGCRNRQADRSPQAANRRQASGVGVPDSPHHADHVHHQRLLEQALVAGPLDGRLEPARDWHGSCERGEIGAGPLTSTHPRFGRCRTKRTAAAC